VNGWGIAFVGISVALIVLGAVAVLLDGARNVWRDRNRRR
jgi:hypothetical protein